MTWQPNEQLIWPEQQRREPVLVEAMRDDPFARLGSLDQKLFQPSSNSTEAPRVPAEPEQAFHIRPSDGHPHRPTTEAEPPTRQLPSTPRTGSMTRTSLRRETRRSPFDIYADQLQTLRRLSMQDRMRGGDGSMARMVREALDRYLFEHDPSKE